MGESQAYELHPLAARDIAEIWEFIAIERANPLTARRVREEIMGGIETLVESPHIGHRPDDLTSRSLRFRRVHSYLIAYVPDARPLQVIAVLHGSRDPRRLAVILRGRV